MAWRRFACFNKYPFYIHLRTATNALVLPVLYRNALNFPKSILNFLSHIIGDKFPSLKYKHLFKSYFWKRKKIKNKPRGIEGEVTCIKHNLQRNAQKHWQPSSLSRGRAGSCPHGISRDQRPLVTKIFSRLPSAPMPMPELPQASWTWLLCDWTGLITIHWLLGFWQRGIGNGSILMENTLNAARVTDVGVGQKWEEPVNGKSQLNLLSRFPFCPFHTHYLTTGSLSAHWWSSETPPKSLTGFTSQTQFSP